MTLHVHATESYEIKGNALGKVGVLLVERAQLNLRRGILLLKRQECTVCVPIDLLFWKEETKLK